MAREIITAALQEALTRAREAGELPASALTQAELQTPRDPRYGDLSSTLALVIGSEQRRPGREVADVLLHHLRLPEGVVERVETAGPGFIDFTLSPTWLRRVVTRIGQEGLQYGRSDAGGGRRLLLEFVSANPTGPIVVVQGRAAALGALSPDSSRTRAGACRESTT